METAAERRALAGFSGEYAIFGAARVEGHFAMPQAEDLLVEGIAPVFVAERARLFDVGIGRGSRLDAIHALDGRVEGPFRVIGWRSLEDGAFVELALEITT